MPSQNSFLNRIASFTSLFHKLGIDGFYTTNLTDIFYFTGLKLSKGQLYILKNGSILVVDSRYIAIAQKQAPVKVLLLAEDSYLKLFDEFSKKKLRVLGFDTQSSLYSDITLLKKHLAAAKKKSARGQSVRLKPLNAPISQVRMVKGPAEIRKLKESAKLLWNGFCYIKKILKTGMTERDVALEFEMYCRKNGAESLSFDPIVAFGLNSAYPHHKTGSKKLRSGEVVLLDLGVFLNGYASDMTRIIFHGKVCKELHHFFEIVKKAHGAALEKCRPGAYVKDLDLAARKEMEKVGLEHLFIHNLGHGVGLDIHEHPFLRSQNKKEILLPGMVITIEPGIYLPGVGGIRYEDMIVITKKGYQNLFEDTPV